MKNTNIFILLIILTAVSIGSASASTDSHIITTIQGPYNLTVSPDRPLTDEDTITIEYDFGDVNMTFFYIGFNDPASYIYQTSRNYTSLPEPDLVPSGVFEINMSDINPEGTLLYQSNEYKKIASSARSDAGQYQHMIHLLMESEEPITPSDEDDLQSLLLSILAPFIMLFLVLLILKEFGLIKDQGGKNK